MKEPSETRLHVAIDIGLGFSAMMRLFEKNTKSALYKEIYVRLPEFFGAKTPEEFKKKHSELCEWGAKTISLAKTSGDNRKNRKKKPATDKLQRLWTWS